MHLYKNCMEQWYYIQAETYSLIHPYISCAILAWGSAYKTHIDKIQIKQNHSARLIFFATTYGECTESALPLLNLLDVLTVHKVYRLQIIKFTYLWHKGLLPKLFSNYFQYASDVHKYNTRYASKQNLYVKKKCELIRENKQSDMLHVLSGTKFP